ncbi:MAG: UDP-N-acetylmuramoyl-tripeptide--D-alanyl-D-alanine ligase [Frankiales bacterium]|nr:UDP-N-acetylmuramoyl-tripeptide--D-alanyl-D-alanine ligase [Frankiales bacterium]
MTARVVAPQLDQLREGLRDLAIASDGKRRRTFAVLGTLPGTREALMDLGRLVVRLDITSLVVVGEAGPVHAGAVLEGSWGQESRHVETEGDALTLLTAELRDDDVVLVSGLPAVARALGAAPEAAL